MLSYYFDLALRSFKRSRGLTVLMIVALGLGIGACMTTLTVYRVLSGDPIPGKSGKLFNIELDAAGMNGWRPGQEPSPQLSRLDAEALLRDGRGDRQVMMSGGRAVIQPEGAGGEEVRPYLGVTRYATADFFAMFEAPFQFGGGWSAADDAGAADVVVLSKDANERLFKGADSRGKLLRVGNKPLRVIGVLAEWRPVPHYYDLTQGNYSKSADFILPFATAVAARMGTSGNRSCWSNSTLDRFDVNAPCAWIQYWVEVGTPAAADAYLQYLKNYSEAQRAAGRFLRPTNVRMRSVMDWLSFKQVLPADVKLQVWLAFGFLLVCLVNTVGLLLAKCLRRSGEIGVRRALGASRRDVFMQFLVEAGTLGLAGGVLGLVLSGLGLWAVRQSPNQYATLAQMDPAMLAMTLGIALFASLLAGVLPAWRATLVTPAIQLKTQ